MKMWLSSAAAVFLLVGLAEAKEITVPTDKTVADFDVPGTTWVGFAVSPNGRLFRTSPNPSESQARARARRECEDIVGRTCRAIAVPQSWNVSAVICSSGDAFVAGVGSGSATPLALERAFRGGGYGCTEIFGAPAIG